MSEPSEEVRRKAQRIRRDRRREPRLFRHLAHVGVLGWVFVLPVIALAWFGHFLTQRTGQIAWAVGGVLSGVAIGAYLVFRNVRDSLEDDE